MKKFKKKGFTLIELIAVLVIMAILAFIVTPLVMNIIRKARISADKRSVDAYGRSIELAIAGYLLDNGKFPTEVSQLTIEYSGNKVECSTTQINTDSSVYLAGCTVAGRSVEGYTYGKEEAVPTYNAYQLGDTVTYNNIDFYVIKDSSASDQTVTLLKAEPLSVSEVNQYGAGHVNMYNSCSEGSDCYQTATDYNGYGGMAYYSSETCGGGTYGDHGYEADYSGCTTDYTASEVKYVVDAWAEDKFDVSDLAMDSTGYKVRLITKEEVESNFSFEEYDYKPCPPCDSYKRQRISEEWMGTNAYAYATMSQYGEKNNSIYVIDSGRNLRSDGVSFTLINVRPVITLKKSAIEN